jgi:hypothetical protein
MQGTKKVLKKLLYPMRTAMGRFIIPPSLPELQNTLIYKAGAFVAADKIAGDYLEFGVYTGSSFVRAYKCLEVAFQNASTPGIWNTEQDCLERRELWTKMRFIAFDSFQGLPKPIGLDKISRDFVEGKYTCSEDDFKANVISQGVPLNRVITIPGWFKDSVNDDTMKKHNIRNAAIVHIDCDLYESAKIVLDAIISILVDGTVIIFDDWFNFRGNPNLGEQRACREWLELHEEITLTQYQKEGPWRNSFIVHKV